MTNTSITTYPTHLLRTMLAIAERSGVRPDIVCAADCGDPVAESVVRDAYDRYMATMRRMREAACSHDRTTTYYCGPQWEECDDCGKRF
jgi:hypothetical protein